MKRFYDDPLFELLRAAAPTVVDPGTTALWEMRLGEVATGRTDLRTVIDAIAAEAERLIGVLQGQSGAKLALGASPRKSRRRWRRSGRLARVERATTASPQDRQPRSREKPTAPTGNASSAEASDPAGRSGPRRPSPTARMVAFARRLARQKGVPLPPGVDRDFEACRRFLDQHAR